MSFGGRLRAGALAVLLGFSVTTHAAEPSALTLAAIEGAGWRAEALRLTVDWAGSRGPELTLSLGVLELPSPVGRLQDVSLRCDGVSISALEVACRDADLRVPGWPPIQATLRYDVPGQRLGVDLFPVPLAGGTLALGLILDVRDGALSVMATGTGLALVELPLPQPHLRGLGFSSGQVSFSLRLESADSGVSAAGELQFSDVACSDDSGRVATEALDALLGFQLSGGNAAPWRGTLTLGVDAGGAYVEPVYLDLAGFPLRLSTALSYEPAADVLSLRGLELEQPGALSVTLDELRLVEGELTSVRGSIRQGRFPALYDLYLAGFLVGTPFATLDIGGELAGRFELAAGDLQSIDLSLSQVHLEDRQGRFAVYGMNGEVIWAARGDALSASLITLDGGFMHGAGFGALTLQLGMAGQAVDLLEPLSVPLLGGALRVNAFSLRNYASDDIALRFEAALEPIDLGQLTLALDWPPFAGSLAGRLPLLTYQDGTVTLGGTLEASAFDGAIEVAELRIAEPFGLVPEVSASIRMRGLDLDQITQVVPFGQVSGRLDGDIEKLRIVKGEPVGFDLSLRTPEDDDSRHRLSQRAVDTISRVAGGGPSLSTTFLRVFKHFGYDRLGVSCRLENDICHMDGVMPAEDGYYLVKGAGLPRVDLIGRVHRVQWSRLVAQLKQALAEGGIAVE